MFFDVTNMTIVKWFCYQKIVKINALTIY